MSPSISRFTVPGAHAHWVGSTDTPRRTNHRRESLLTFISVW